MRKVCGVDDGDGCHVDNSDVKLKRMRRFIGIFSSSSIGRMFECYSFIYSQLNWFNDRCFKHGINVCNVQLVLIISYVNIMLSYLMSSCFFSFVSLYLCQAFVSLYINMNTVYNT